ncbi:MAG: C4-dicarboxylate ABC transporter [Rhodospirillaceae bacterium]|nr:C4-dicarboxylate ABC transporter [Rhodospirillaceae bacterium]MAX60895.1 C4-dicarboxylate ABC transporter [Rhodospirillaceae bacterium]MAX65217.1 C4-dicarboxylate ABC transporter [Rhodospirillaceae bacterium]MBB55632.1 C4-dicarboxylate ABC transporter [Rhodospirillaceae bacterium]|tara:strand:+ start:18001 stop:20835 length:2835 start_codon:yes stop_codon:yes gene_type:complete
MSDKNNEAGLSQSELDDLVASNDTGGRAPTNQTLVLAMATIALLWSLFQVWIASPIPYEIGFGAFSSKDARAIHLTFALILAFMAYPAFKSSPRSYIPITDWIIMFLGASCAFYYFAADMPIVASLGGELLSDRPANANTTDVIVFCIGIVALLEATRRSLGPPLAILGIFFLAYTYFGPYFPGLLQWKGVSFEGLAYHQWLSQSGVFGIALGVSTDLVFLFVLFGALLDKAGAGSYFIKVAFALMGHLRGGPAKAAVVASGMTGLISGSSIANVVTTGTFTIPMMKRVGFSNEKAGAVEVASSVNGQIMPPVMGAAAFLMVEYVNIPYFDVVKHAFLPAIISYIALVYIVHLEAMKQDMPALERVTTPKPLKLQFLSFLMSAAMFVAIGGAVAYLSDAYFMLTSSPALLLASAIALGAIILLSKGISRGASEGTKAAIFSTFTMVVGYCIVGGFFTMYLLQTISQVLSANGLDYLMLYIVSALLILVYVFLVSICARYPDLEVDDPNSPIVTLPMPRPTIMSGLHFLLPVLVLIWMLMIERKSPSLSAFWAVMLMIFILITQRSLFAFFRGETGNGMIGESIRDLIAGLISGARNMIGIGIATAAAGIIVGAVSQTGIGSALADLVELMSFGQLILILIWTAVLSLVLGMGLPTTANYIVVSSLLAPVVVALGQQNGLVVPLIAVHLFVFYFGIMADVTPPVGLASFAAAAVSGGDPIKTGFVAFFYSMRTALLPFLFIFNTDLLLIDVGPLQAVIVFIVATAAMLIFTAGMQGFFLARSRFYESVLLILVAFTLFRPGFWMDMIISPTQSMPPNTIVEQIGALEPGTDVVLLVDGLDKAGAPIEFTAIVEVPEGATGQDRLENLGLELIIDGEKVTIDNVVYDSPADKQGVFDWDQVIMDVQVPSNQPPKELLWIPALALFFCIGWVQSRRQKRINLGPAAA